VNFTDVIEINTLELGKVSEQTDNTKKHDWLQFLKAEREEEFDMLAERRPEIKKAVVELKRLSQSEETQRLYETREKALWAEQSRTRTAQKKTAREIAAKLLSRGIPLQHIVEDTGLRLEEVEKLENPF